MATNTRLLLPGLVKRWVHFLVFVSSAVLMAIMKACRDFDFLVSFLGDDGRGRGDGGASGCLEQLEFAIRSATGESWIYRFESYENNV
jgi:hypothetical protein